MAAGETVAECEICGHCGPALRCKYFDRCQRGRCLICLPEKILKDKKIHDHIFAIRFICEDCTQAEGGNITISAEALGLKTLDIKDNAKQIGASKRPAAAGAAGMQPKAAKKQRKSVDAGPVDDDLSSGGEDQAAADNPAHAALQQKLQQKEKQAAKKPKATPKQSKAMVAGSKPGTAPAKPAPLQDAQRLFASTVVSAGNGHQKAAAAAITAAAAGIAAPKTNTFERKLLEAKEKKQKKQPASKLAVFDGRKQAQLLHNSAGKSSALAADDPMAPRIPPPKPPPNGAADTQHNKFADLAKMAFGTKTKEQQVARSTNPVADIQMRLQADAEKQKKEEMWMEGSDEEQDEEERHERQQHHLHHSSANKAEQLWIGMLRITHHSDEPTWELAVKVQKMPNTGTNTADHDKFKNSHAESMSGVVVSRAGVRNSIPLGHDALDHVAVRITERTGHKSMRNGIAPIIRALEASKSGQDNFIRLDTGNGDVYLTLPPKDVRRIGGLDCLVMAEIGPKQERAAPGLWDRTQQPKRGALKMTTTHSILQPALPVVHNQFMDDDAGDDEDDLDWLAGEGSVHATMAEPSAPTTSLGLAAGMPANPATSQALPSLAHGNFADGDLTAVPIQVTVDDGAHQQQHDGFMGDHFSDSATLLQAHSSPTDSFMDVDDFIAQPSMPQPALSWVDESQQQPSAEVMNLQWGALQPTTDSLHLTAPATEAVPPAHSSDFDMPMTFPSIPAPLGESALDAICSIMQLVDDVDDDENLATCSAMVQHAVTTALQTSGNAADHPVTSQWTPTAATSAPSAAAMQPQVFNTVSDLPPGFGRSRANARSTTGTHESSSMAQYSTIGDAAAVLSGAVDASTQRRPRVSFADPAPLDATVSMDLDDSEGQQPGYAVQQDIEGSEQAATQRPLASQVPPSLFQPQHTSTSLPITVDLPAAAPALKHPHAGQYAAPAVTPAPLVAPVPAPLPGLHYSPTRDELAGQQQTGAEQNGTVQHLPNPFAGTLVDPRKRQADHVNHHHHHQQQQQQLPRQVSDSSRQMLRQSSHQSGPLHHRHSGGGPSISRLSSLTLDNVLQSDEYHRGRLMPTTHGLEKPKGRLTVWAVGPWRSTSRQHVS
eukprot:jgi/Chrzof1/14640/Cz09g10130.t1